MFEVCSFLPLKTVLAFKKNMTLIQTRRDRRVDIEGLPVINFSNTGDFTTWSIDFTADSKTRRFAPIDTIEIRNKHATIDLPFKINDGALANDEVQASSVRPVSFASPCIRKVTIDGSGGALAAGDVKITVTRKAMTDDEFRRRQTESPLRKILNLLGF